MKRRLIDINPPFNRQEPPAQDASISGDRGSREKSRRIGTALAFALAALFVCPALFAHLFFARATIQVWPQITQLRMQERIGAQLGYEGMDLEKKIIGARMIEHEMEQTLRFPASGKTFKEEGARGIIRVYNEYSTQPQTLVANTRFVSEDGKVFRSQATVSVPGGHMEGRRMVPGVLDVEVTASEPGEEYNIDPSKFSLPGLVGTPLYTKIYGESLGPMSGGAAREVSVVTEDDIASARATLTETLKAQAIENLLASVSFPWQVLSDSLEATVAKEDALVKPGAELDQFVYGAKVRATAVAFHKEKADALTQHLLASYLGPNQAIDENTVSFEYSLSSFSREAAFIPLDVEAAAHQYEKLDARALVSRMRGSSVSELGKLMQEYPFLAKASASLWPFWMSAMPKDAKRITVELLVGS